jgi:hypothetical protein
MERLMDTIVNVQEVQAELDRAARDARSGPADVRAGRFVHRAAAKVGDGISHSQDRRHAPQPRSED